MSQKFDLAVIGAGPGGYVAAIRAAQFGMKVVCVDKRATLGGTCLNVGCIPSKTLLQSSEIYSHVLHEGQALGLRYSKISFDFEQMMKRKDHVVHSLVEGIAGLFKRHHILFFHGEAQFIDSHHLLISSEGSQETIEADYILISTGSEPIALPSIPFDQDKIVSSTEALSFKEVPKKLAVIGGGVIGVELASVYNRLGCDVTIIEMLPLICPTLDVAISKELTRVLKSQGIKFLLSKEVTSCKVESNGISLQLKSEAGTQEVDADVCLVSIGRRPFTANLGLEKVSIVLDKKGFIPVDSVFRTVQANIFAIGDVIDGVMLAHRASQEGVTVIEWIKGGKPLIDYMSVPNVIYTYPEVAAVGMTEEEVFAASLIAQIGTVYFKGNPRARCSGETDGFLKIIGDKKTGTVLGMHIIGPHASELIACGVLAIQKRMTLEEIARAAFAHPTLSEAIKEAALIALSKPMHA